MVTKKERKDAIARLRAKKLLKKSVQTSLVLNVEKPEKKEPKQFFKKIVEEDRRNFFFR